MRLCDEWQAVNKLSSFNVGQIYRAFPLHQPSVDSLRNKIIKLGTYSKLLIVKPYYCATNNTKNHSEIE